MADLDDLYSQIPTDQIANRLGADRAEVNQAIRTLVPVLVGGIRENVQAADIDSTELESTVAKQGTSGLLDGGVSIEQVDEQSGEQAVARIFGGNDTSQVASALSGAGAGGNTLIKQLLPILVPIVLAYIGKRLTQGAGTGAAPQPAQAGAGGGGLADILGGILGGAGGGTGGGGGNNPLGTILGNVLGGDKGGAIGDILGGLVRGR